MGSHSRMVLDPRVAPGVLDDQRIAGDHGVLADRGGDVRAPLVRELRRQAAMARERQTVRLQQVDGGGRDVQEPLRGAGDLVEHGVTLAAGEPGVGDGGQALRIGQPAGLAPRLVRVERLVGAPQQGLPALARDAHSATPTELPPWCGVASRSRRATSAARSAGQSGSRARNSSPPRRTSMSVTRSSCRPDRRARLEHAVAGVVTLRVVEGLERVEVQRRDGQRLARCARHGPARAAARRRARGGSARRSAGRGPRAVRGSGGASGGRGRWPSPGRRSRAAPCVTCPRRGRHPPSPPRAPPPACRQRSPARTRGRRRSWSARGRMPAGWPSRSRPRRGRRRSLPAVRTRDRRRAGVRRRSPRRPAREAGGRRAGPRRRGAP